jgi:hypothetical protein
MKINLNKTEHKTGYIWYHVLLMCMLIHYVWNMHDLCAYFLHSRWRLKWQFTIWMVLSEIPAYYSEDISRTLIAIKFQNLILIHFVWFVCFVLFDWQFNFYN